MYKFKGSKVKVVKFWLPKTVVGEIFMTYPVWDVKQASLKDMQEENFASF